MLGLWWQGISEKSIKKNWQPFSHQFDARILKICKKIMFKFQDGKIFLLLMNKKMFSLKKIILRSKGQKKLNRNKIKSKTKKSLPMKPSDTINSLNWLK